MPEPSRWKAVLRSVSVLLAILAVLALFLVFPSAPPLARKGLPLQYQQAHNPSGDYVLGISIGTTRACASVKRNNILEIIPNSHGRRTVPGNVTIDTVKTLPDVVCRDLHDLDSRQIRHQRPSLDYNRAVLDGAEAFFKVLKADAEAYLGVPVTHAVATIPSYFNDTERQTMKDSANAAGLTILRLLNEPTAANIAHGLDKRQGEFYSVVLDVGARSLDVTVLFIEDGVYEIVATAKDLEIGGDHFTTRVVDSLHGVLGQSEWHTWLEVDRAKRELSNSMVASVPIRVGCKSFDLTRAYFERVNDNLFRQSLGRIDEALREANISKDNISYVLLMGGSARIPRIKELATTYFGRELLDMLPPDLAVVLGAAIQGDIINTEPDGGSCTCCPDYTPLSLGIEVSGGVVQPLIPRHTVYPTRRSFVFSTAATNQTDVELRLFRGERALTEDNEYLASLKLDGIVPSPRGVLDIQVIIEIDANDRITLIAEDTVSGASRNITSFPHEPPPWPWPFWDSFDQHLKDMEAFADFDNAIRERTFSPGSPKNGSLLPRSRGTELAIVQTVFPSTNPAVRSETTKVEVPVAVNA